MGFAGIVSFFSLNLSSRLRFLTTHTIDENTFTKDIMLEPRFLISKCKYGARKRTICLKYLLKASKPDSSNFQAHLAGKINLFSVVLIIFLLNIRNIEYTSLTIRIRISLILFGKCNCIAYECWLFDHWIIIGTIDFRSPVSFRDTLNFIRFQYNIKKKTIYSLPIYIDIFNTFVFQRDIVFHSHSSKFRILEFSIWIRIIDDLSHVILRCHF